MRRFTRHCRHGDGDNRAGISASTCYTPLHLAPLSAYSQSFSIGRVRFRCSSIPRTIPNIILATLIAPAVPAALVTNERASGAPAPRDNNVNCRSAANRPTQATERFSPLLAEDETHSRNAFPPLNRNRFPLYQRPAHRGADDFESAVQRRVPNAIRHGGCLQRLM